MKTMRGRWAPSPTGLLHVGSARTALVAWLSVRSQGGSLVWRTEDLDGPRSVEGSIETAMDDLAWLGLDWDEGPNLGGEFEPYEQSRRNSIYNESLETLYKSKRLFPCTLSRADLREVASAPTSTPNAYPASLRPQFLAPDWFRSLDESAAVRFLTVPGTISFADRVYGVIEQDVSQFCGDFVVMRRDGYYSYQLAATVDDIVMEISEVVRGADLLDSTPRQIQLIEALGASVPTYAHVPLVLGSDGRKLSKRHQGISLQLLRESGCAPEVLCGHLAYSLGLTISEAPIAASELIAQFEWSRIRRDPWVVADGFLQTVVGQSSV